MMRVLSTRPLLRKLMVSLAANGHPSYKLPIVGSIRSVLQNLWAYEAVVDNWPNYKSIIMRPHQEEVHRFNFDHASIFCYGDVQSFSQLVNQPNVIPWDRRLYCRVIPEHLIDTVAAAAEQNGGKLEDRYGEVIAILYMPLDEVKMPELKNKLESPLPEGFTLGKLRVEHAELVLDTWPLAKFHFKPGDHAARESWLNEIRHCLKHQISSAVYNPSGEPVSWQVTRLEGDVGYGYTMHDYRKLGIYEHVSGNITWLMRQSKMPYFGFSTINNTPVTNVYRDKIGCSTGVVGRRFYVPNQAHL